MPETLFTILHSGFDFHHHPEPPEPFKQQGSSPVLALMACILVTTINSFSPVGLWDYEDDSGFSLTLQLAVQIELTINQD